jgi:magnesium chelatase family protein
MLARIKTAAIVGVEACPVTVEVDTRKGGATPGLNLVGLPSTRVSEGKVRIRAALLNCGYKLDAARVTINLAPAELRKDTASFELPIALALLATFDYLPVSALEGLLAVGELALDGSVRPVRGLLAAATVAREQGLQTMLVPTQGAREAAVVEGMDIRAVSCISGAVDHLRGEQELPHVLPPPALSPSRDESTDLAEVRGQALPKRALEIAAAGGHNLAMVGPPGCGKSMLARRLPGILPPPSFDEALETTRIHSVAGLLNGTPLVRQRPFRAPHHSISPVGLVGGGPHLRPGELSLAHHGVLFLDELLEFPRHTLEGLRQPLEDRRITITRARGSVHFPADVQLVAAMNPCPCGHWGDPRRACVCSDRAIARYWGRLSGPLLDRIDLQITVHPVDFDELTGIPAEEPSAAVAERVLGAQTRQQARLGPDGRNARMGAGAVREHCRLQGEGRQILARAVERFGLSARAVERVLKVARTVADLAGRDELEPADLLEAVGYREVRLPV